MNDELLRAESRALIDKIRMAWKDVPKPIVIADSGCPEDADIIKLFANRTVSDIDLEHRNYQELSPMIFMSDEAMKYFIQVYFYYCLDADRLKTIHGMTPWNHLLDSLVSKQALKHYTKIYSVAQARCIVDFLNFVRLDPELFGVMELVKQIDRAIIKWKHCADILPPRP